jgi:hypothetical protein
LKVRLSSKRISPFLWGLRASSLSAVKFVQHGPHVDADVSVLEAGAASTVDDLSAIKADHMVIAQGATSHEKLVRADRTADSQSSSLGPLSC